MDFFALFSGLGGGYVARELLGLWRLQNSRVYRERRDAYIGLIKSFHELRNPEKESDFTYWCFRCEVVGSKAIRERLQNIRDKYEGSGNDPVTQTIWSEEFENQIFDIVRNELRLDQ